MKHLTRALGRLNQRSLLLRYYRLEYLILEHRVAKELFHVDPGIHNNCLSLLNNWCYEIFELKISEGSYFLEGEELF